MRDEAVEQPTVARLDVRIKKRPGVIAAKALAFFDEQDRHFRPRPRHRQRGKAAR
jgi:hypothetical protein